MRKNMIRLGVAALVAVGAGAGFSIPAQAGPAPGSVVYDSTVSPLPGNQPSEAFQATQTGEFGDLVTLAGSQRELAAVTVTMSSWACQNGSWNGGDCVTSPGATFPMPLTITLYNVGANNTPGSVLATETETFNIPYRPSASGSCTGGRWFDGAQGCFNGFASNVMFNLSSLHVVLPDSLIWGISYNTSGYGQNPYGYGNPCDSTSAGCFYDSLNVALSPQVRVGSEPDPGTAYQNSTTPGQYCDNGAGGTGTFRMDSPGMPCWAGYVPAAQITATAVPPPGNATCNNETLPAGTYQNVTVPAGGICTINSSDTILGDVQVQNGGALADFGASIGGNLQLNNPAWIDLGRGGSVGGDLQVTGTTSKTPANGQPGSPNDGSTANDLCNTTVHGNVTVQGSGSAAPFDIGAGPDCGFPLTIGGNLTVQNNAASDLVGPAANGSGNSVKGNITVQNNTGGGQIEDNSSTNGNCQLHGDNPVFTPAMGNTTTAGKTDSCNTPG